MAVSFFVVLFDTLFSDVVQFWATFGKSLGMFFGVPGDLENQARTLT